MAYDYALVVKVDDGATPKFNVAWREVRGHDKPIMTNGSGEARHRFFPS